MKTLVKLPKGHLGIYPSVMIELEMTGEHHKTLLSGAESLYERVVASVIGSLLDPEYDVTKISLPDLMYLFFLVRAQSIGSVYKTSWVCNHSVIVDGVKTNCGHENSYEINLSKLAIVSVPEKYVIPEYETEWNGETVKFGLRSLTLADEFAVVDDLLEAGYTKDELYSTKAYDYARARIKAALVLKADKYATMTSDEKEEFLNKISFSKVNSLLTDMRTLDYFGPDLSPKPVRCEKCKGVSQIGLPFSSQFLLSA